MTTTELKDRSTGLVLFGILEILLGVLCVGLALLSLLGLLLMSRLPPSGAPVMPARMILPAVLMYVGVAAAFIILGIGSIRARRWAHALMLVASWGWLAIGVAGSAMWLAILPELQTQMQAQMRATGGALGTGFTTVVLVFSGVLVLVVYILLPTAFVLFYRSPHVRATCRQRNPDPSWTDRVPLPVLGLCLAFWCSAAMAALVMPLYGATVLFGRVLTGPVAVLAALVMAAGCAAVAMGAYRQKVLAWWGAVVAIVVGVSSSVLTFRNAEALDELYRAMDYPPQMIAMSRPYWSGPKMMIAMGVSGLLYLGFLVYVKRYFDDQARRN